MIQTVIRPGFEREVEARFVRRVARSVLETEGVDKNTSLTVVVTDDDEIQALNQQFRGLDEPTDVLSFGEEPTERPFVTAPGEPQYLGDVVLSLPRAQQQAVEQGHSTKDELTLLIVHGILHLLGYDHATPEEEADMWARQDKIIKVVEGKRNE